MAEGSLKLICSKCQIIKPCNEFNKRSTSRTGYRCECKVCFAEQKRIRYRNNRAEIRAKAKEYYLKNKEYIDKKAIEYGNKHRDRIINYQKSYYIQNQERIKLRTSRYSKENKELSNSLKYKYRTKREAQDPVYKLSNRIRSTIAASFRHKRYTKKSSTYRLVGLDFGSLFSHLVNTFEARYGIKYENQKVHIDHIIPCITAKTVQELEKLQHYSNLQWLTPEDNLRKSSKVC